ncbi:DUF6504 family protein [bacterium]|nr:DUF6504 family protein [bacterium]MCG2677954.1 DUF6504 family protein [bacterium]
MFNRHARWDRVSPSGEGAEELDEPISVGAVFKGSRVEPRWFNWRGRRYPVKEVTYRWRDRRGEACLHYFAVSDGVATYEICFDNQGLDWRLCRICPG